MVLGKSMMLAENLECCPRKRSLHTCTNAHRMFPKRGLRVCLPLSLPCQDQSPGWWPCADIATCKRTFLAWVKCLVAYGISIATCSGTFLAWVKILVAYGTSIATCSGTFLAWVKCLVAYGSNIECFRQRGRLLLAGTQKRIRQA
jgi:hypothetical protein